MVTHAYDGYGNEAEQSDAIGPRWSATFDERGRMLQRTDGRGHATDYAYDLLDRVTKTTLPGATRAEVTTEYVDASRLRIDTDPMGRISETRFDAMGRTIEEIQAKNTPVQRRRVHTYDANGNRLTTTDWRGHVTASAYDNANRLIRLTEPLQRVTTYTHDALGHVLTETVSGTEGTRRVEYAYDHPLYLRTVTRRVGEGMQLESTATYDGNGNLLTETDPRNATTTHAYDDRDRRVVTRQPEQREIATVYDDADRKLSETLSGANGFTQRRSWTYDVRGRVETSTDGSNAVTGYVYDLADNRIETHRPNGGIWKQSFDARNQVENASGPIAGMLSTYVYDDAGNRVFAATPDGREVTTTYDELNRTKGASDQLGIVEQVEYDADDHVTAKVDALGRRTTSVFDELGREKERMLPPAPMARVLKWTYTTWGEAATETDANSGTTTHVYDDFGRRETSTTPQQITRSWTYDPNGNVDTETDGRGLVTAYAHDALNRRTQQTDPAPESTTQTWAYDAANNIVEHIDRAGEKTAFAYDGENRETSRTRSGGQLTVTVEQRTYDANGNIKTISDALNRVTTYAYDTADRKTSETRPLNFVRRWTYHPWGGIATNTNADGHVTTYTYDERQRLKTEIDALGQVTTHGYDAVGNRTSTQRPGNTAQAPWLYGYDAANRLESVTTPIAAKTVYGYDAHGNRTSITDANLHETTFGFDADHRLETTTLADGTTWTYTLGGNGNRERITVAGRRVDITYDALNRERSRTYTAGASDDTGTHNPRAETTSYDGNGRIIAQTQQRPDGTTSQSRTWDALSRLTDETDFNGRHSQWRYDARGNREKRNDEAGDTLFEADTLDRIVSVKPQANAGFPATDITLVYTPEGRLAQINHPSGARSEYAYDEIGRLKTLTHVQNSQQVAQYVFEYDANGNRERETLTSGGGASTETRITDYGYDADDRLTWIDSPESTTTYTLDDVGNRKTEEVRAKPGNTLTHDITYEYDERDRLQQTEDAVTGVITTYTYDTYGNIASKTESGTTTQYRHNAQDRLATLHVQGAPPANATAYRYGPDGLRIQKSSTGTATQFRYDQGQLRLETNAIGNVVNAYERAAGHFVTQRSSAGSEQLHFLHDAQRSPVRIVRRDGALAGTTRFDAWGNRIASGGMQSAVGYTGYYTDVESGFNYAQQRYQLPGIGRFLQSDPGPVVFERPITVNRYAYGNANPVIYIDADGKIALLANGAESLADFRGWIKGQTATYNDNALGTVGAVSGGVARGLVVISQ